MTGAMANPGWVYVKKPDPVPKASEIFAMQDQDLPMVKDGMFMARVLAVAVAPHTRAFLELPGNNTGAEALGLHRTIIGETVPCELVAEVVESKCKGYKVGDRVVCFAPLVQYQVFRGDGKDRPDGRAPPKVFASVSTEDQLNLSTGITAYMVANQHPCGMVDEHGCWGFVKQLLGWTPRKTVLVTSAAGGIGIVAGQLYKNKGCRVIGVTSTRAKADRIKEFGYDEAIAYKEEDMDTRLGELAPEGIDVFFDNVGAEQLDAGSKHMKVGGKIVSVGCAAEIDNYATGKISGWKEYHRMVAKELQVGGFFLTNHLHRIPMAVISLIIMQKRGKLKSVNTVVKGSWADFTKCVDRLHSGDTFGRLVLVFDDQGSTAIGA